MAERTITFRIEGEEIPTQVFHQKVGAFLDVLRVVEQSVAVDDAEAPPPVRWIVESIRAESPVVMTLRADPPVDERAPDIAPKVIDFTTAGLKRIQSRAPLDEIPSGLSLPALESVRTLVRPSNDELMAVTVITPDETITLSSQATVNVDRLLRAVYQHPGTIEGILETVSVSGQRPRIHLRDRLTGRAVICHVPKDRLGEIIDVFGRRVSVYGRVKTNELGDILSATSKTFD